MLSWLLFRFLLCRTFRTICTSDITTICTSGNVAVVWWNLLFMCSWNSARHERLVSEPSLWHFHVQEPILVERIVGLETPRLAFPTIYMQQHRFSTHIMNMHSWWRIVRTEHDSFLVTHCLWRDILYLCFILIMPMLWLLCVLVKYRANRWAYPSWRDCGTENPRLRNSIYAMWYIFKTSEQVTVQTRWNHWDGFLLSCLPSNKTWIMYGCYFQPEQSCAGINHNRSG